MNNLTILVTACGSPGAIGLFKSLKSNGEREIKIIGTDMNPNAIGLFLADKGYVVPPTDTEEYLPEIFEIIKEEEVSLIIPNGALEVFSKNIQKFEEIGVKVLVSKEEALKIALNKGKLFSFLHKRGIPTPEYIAVNEGNKFENAVYKLGYPENPVCFKPAVSEGTRGFRILREDVNRLDLLLNTKPDSTITTLDEVLNVLKAVNSFPELLVMEYLPGKEYSVDILVKEGEALITLPRVREKVDLGLSTVGLVENNKEIVKICEQVARELNLDYNINIQLKFSHEMIPKIIEVNPRISGTIVLCAGSGVNLPYFAVKMALGEEISQIKPRYGTRMIRYWSEVFIDEDRHSFTL